MVRGLVKRLLPSALKESYSVRWSRPVTVSPSSWMNTTNLCCRLSATKSFLKTDKFIYVMEFKQGATAEEALAQINEKGYADAFASDSRTLYKIGVSFSDEQRNIERWLAE